MTRVVPLLPLLLALAVAAGEKKKPADGGGAALVAARCSSCHSPNRLNHRALSRDGWRAVVERMRRMPQSGISSEDARRIVDYLARRDTKAPAARAARGRVGRYGEPWLSILEIATARNDRVRLGGVEYEVERAGDGIVLIGENAEKALTLPAGGKAARTYRVDGWRIGRIAYEVHVVLYEIGEERIRVARALKKLSPVRNR